MYIALTGTPGTGKTETAKLLGSRGFKIASVRELAKEHGAAEKKGDDIEIDVEGLASELPETTDLVIVEGHLAHLLPNELCIVLRCHPEILRKRLGERGYNETKLRENLEAEAIDLILTESIELCRKVFEIDASELKPEKIADSIESIINGKDDGFSPGKVDWSQVVLDWY